MGSSDITFDQASLKSVHFEPTVGVVFAQHTGDELLSGDEIVKKMDRNIPALLRCSATTSLDEFVSVVVTISNWVVAFPSLSPPSI